MDTPSDSTLDMAAAAARGPDAIAKYLAALPDDQFEATWLTMEAAIVQNSPVSFDGFMSFARVMLYDPHTQTVIEPAPHHQEWIKTCIEHNRVVILAPPESAKTTIISILLVSYLIGKNPATQNMVISVSDDQAEKVVGHITAYIEHHPGWKLCFPDIVPDKKRGWGFDKGFFVKRKGNYGKWVQERGGRKDPTLLGVGYKNRAIIGKRADGIIVVDDMIDEENSRSDAELEHAKNIFKKTISSRVTEEGHMVVVGTPWREDDIYAEVVETGLYKSFVTPAWEKDDKGKRHSYWPKQWSIKRLEEKQRELGNRGFELMYLMNLEASKGTILTRQALEPGFPMINIGMNWPIFYGIDPAITSHDIGTKGRRGKRSYFALAKVRAAPFGLVVYDGIRDRFTLAQAINIIKTHAENDHPVMIKMETWGFGETFLQQIFRELPGLVILPYQSTKDKASRFMELQRHFEFNRVRVSTEENPFLKAFKAEWVGFPGAAFTDTLDAVAIAVDAAGISVFSGEDAIQEKAKDDKIRVSSPWHKLMGLPKSNFAGSARRKVMRYGE